MSENKNNKNNKKNEKNKLSATDQITLNTQLFSKITKKGDYFVVKAGKIGTVIIKGGTNSKFLIALSEFSQSHKELFEQDNFQIQRSPSILAAVNHPFAISGMSVKDRTQLVREYIALKLSENLDGLSQKQITEILDAKCKTIQDIKDFILNLFTNSNTKFNDKNKSDFSSFLKELSEFTLIIEEGGGSASAPASNSNEIYVSKKQTPPPGDTGGAQKIVNNMLTIELSADGEKTKKNPEPTKPKFGPQR